LPWLNDFLESLPAHSCFISHSIKDSRFCKKVCRDLRSEAVKC
jgi:hypothetical protein